VRRRIAEAGLLCTVFAGGLDAQVSGGDDLGERMGADPESWDDLLTRHFEG
jgi:hypothetical protein